ncbi:MAG: dicarboxylate/amino acid:cation symporter [Planctomycetota bacterium]|jgi:Na+/H+-dicarboxylate symporter
MRQHTLIFGGMLLGAGLGLLLAGKTGDFALNVVWLCDLCGTEIFIGALKMIVAPLIFFSILAGITSLATKGELWAIGWRTLLFYFVTTSVAVAIGLFFVLTIRPGHRGDREGMRASWEQQRQEIHREYGDRERRIEQAREKTPGEAIRDNLRQIIMNPFRALSTTNSLGIIFFAILLGIALIMVGDRARPVLPVIEGINAAIMMLTRWIMWAAPFFIFCLVASLLAKHGTAVFGTLLWYVITVLVGIACHVVFLLAAVRVAGGISPLAFVRGIRRAWAVAFATRSSAATLPVTMECVREELKVPRQVSDFVLPIGATVNMDGTALYQGVAIIFLIQLFGGLEGALIDVTAVTTVIIFLTAVLASIGTAAVPDAGLFTMVLVATAVGLDIQYIALIFAVDAFLDMFRTSTNIMGDAVGAVVVHRLAGARVAA